MAKVTVYKNSKLASACSIIGYLMIVCGVYLCFQDEIAVGIVLLVLGIAFKLLAGFISKKKSQKEAKQNQGV